jgi:predicted DNA-binding transcriptional regulator AlpA
MSARPEVTGRKSASPTLPLCFSVKEFCAAHRISVSYYYELKKQGRAPREMMLGTRRIISAEAAAAWRAENTVERTS